MIAELRRMSYDPCYVHSDGGLAAPLHASCQALALGAIQHRSGVGLPSLTGADGEPVGEGVPVFDDLRARPPVAVVSTGDSLGVLFSRQPYFDSPVLDLYFAIVRSDGTVLTGPVTVGRVKRGEPFDAAPSWMGDEFGIVLAAPLDDISGLPRTFDLARIDESGTVIGSWRLLGGDTDRAMRSIAWDGEAWGLAYAFSDAASTGQGIEFVRAGCIPQR